MKQPLPSPAFYFPPAGGVYAVTPGLRPLGTPMGNGPADALAFQFDDQFGRYRAEKLEARAERIGKYVMQSDASPAAMRRAVEFMLERLPAEHPALFLLRTEASGARSLDCHLTGERLAFGPEGELLRADPPPEGPPYISAFDALAMQIQEDLALNEMRGAECIVTALHLCVPSHWAGEEKIGRDFNAVHAPVAHFGPIAERSAGLVAGLIARGPFVRFAWSMTADARLNHHPRAGWKKRAEGGDDSRRFAGVRGPADLFLRVERQTLAGFPDASAFLFAIRVCVYNCAALPPGRRAELSSALASMSPETRAYKGLAADMDAVLAALAG